MGLQFKETSILVFTLMLSFVVSSQNIDVDLNLKSVTPLEPFLKEFSKIVEQLNTTNNNLETFAQILENFLILTRKETEKTEFFIENFSDFINLMKSLDPYIKSLLIVTIIFEGVFLLLMISFLIVKMSRSDYNILK